MSKQNGGIIGPDNVPQFGETFERKSKTLAVDVAST